ncbi:MAG: alpha/beta hydrolase fold domain-containing protein [Alphaproteobacteria bacterium]
MPPKPQPDVSPTGLIDVPAEELAQARRLNRALRFSPRFRATGGLAKFMIQASMRAGQAVTPLGVTGVIARNRRLVWNGETLNLRILTTPGVPAKGVYIDYHGGGWSIGNAAMDDPINARIARDCGLAVVSVDYGLMPEVRLPQILAQCAAAADWAFSNAKAEFGADAMIVGGESAGGHLAACTVLNLKAMRPDFARLKGAVLIYGVYDLSSTPSVRNATRDALVLHGPSMQRGLGLLAPDRDEAGLRDPSISPLYADLAGLPPAIMVAGTLDPLIDDSTMLAKHWQDANGNAKLLIAPAAPHAFNRFPTRLAARTNGMVRDWINARVAGEAMGAGRVAAE